MKKQLNISVLMLTLVLALSIIGCQAQPAPAPAAPQMPAPTAVPQAAAPTMAPQPSFDIKVYLDRYFSTLPDGWSAVAPAALNDQLAVAKPFIVDLREPQEIADSGYLAGAVNIPIRSLLKNLNKLPAKDQAIIAMCGSGHRSAMALVPLQMLGYSNVKSLAGGFGAWKEAKLPFVTGKPAEATVGKSPDLDLELFAALDKYMSNLPDGWGTVAPDKLSEQLAAAKPFQVEVREVKEVADNGMIAGSVNVPIRTLFKNVDKLPSDKSAAIIAECGSGHRSAMTMVGLNLQGYTNVKSLAGGFGAWTKGGLPVAKQ